MRSQLFTRDLTKVANALSLQGIRATNPCPQGALAGTITVHGEITTILRIDCRGTAFLYNPKEGTLNKRIPLAQWDVDFSRGWPNTLATNVHQFLNKTQSHQEITTTEERTTKPPRTQAKPFSIHQVKDILNQWGNGTPVQAIAHSLLGHSHNASTRITRVIVGGQINKGKLEPLYRIIDNTEIEPLRLQALQSRSQHNIPHDHAATNLLQRLNHKS